MPALARESISRTDTMRWRAILVGAKTERDRRSSTAASAVFWVYRHGTRQAAGQAELENVRVDLLSKLGELGERPDCVAGHVGLEVRRETGKE
jgi:hypothetical protein